MCKINLCICLGYESLTIPLNFINKGEKVIIYSNRRDIVLFCKDQKIPFIKAPVVNLRIAATHPKKAKKMIINSLKDVDVKNINFHITHKNFALHSIILVFFAKYGRVFFHKTEVDTEKIYSFKFFPSVTIKKKVKYLLLYWIYYRYLIFHHFKFIITFRCMLGKLIPVMKEKEMRRLGVNIVEYKDKHDFFYKVYSNFSIDIVDCKNLFVHTDVNELSNYAVRDSIEKIYSVIGEYDITYKLHPNRNLKLNADEKVYPSFLPAELLVNHTKNAVVGMLSATFRYSIRNKNIKTISCIDLIEWKDKKKKQFYKDYMNEWGDGIIYPKTEAELRGLLKG